MAWLLLREPASLSLGLAPPGPEFRRGEIAEILTDLRSGFGLSMSDVPMDWSVEPAQCAKIEGTQLHFESAPCSGKVTACVQGSTLCETVPFDVLTPDLIVKLVPEQDIYDAEGTASVEAFVNGVGLPFDDERLAWSVEPLSCGSLEGGRLRFGTTSCRGSVKACIRGTTRCAREQFAVRGRQTFPKTPTVRVWLRPKNTAYRVENKVRVAASQVDKHGETVEASFEWSVHPARCGRVKGKMLSFLEAPCSGWVKACTIGGRVCGRAPFKVAKPQKVVVAVAPEIEVALHPRSVCEIGDKLAVRAKIRDPQGRPALLRLRRLDPPGCAKLVGNTLTCLRGGEGKVKACVKGTESCKWAKFVVLDF